MAVKCVLWDFDGVILDSMHIRDLGFEHIFASFPRQEVDQLMSYHRQNGGLSRYHKIRFFFEKIRKEDITEEQVNLYATQFSEIMRKQLIEPANLIEDAVTFIRNNYTQYEFHIVSGSDEAELRFLNEKLGTAQYFKTINGSPTPKNQIVKRLLEELTYTPAEICLIGDSKNDKEAAEVNGISFYGYNNPSLINNRDKYIHSFSQIQQL